MPRPRLRRLSSVRRHLEIAVLELVSRALRRVPRLRLRLPHWPQIPHWHRSVARHARRRPRWAAGIAAAVLVPSLAVGATLVQRASAHPGDIDPQSVTTAPVTPGADPTPPPPPPIDPAVFKAAAKRAPASPALQRLPQVDLNGLSVAGIPRPALRAYVTAAKVTDAQDPSCHLHWWLLAGIGLVESDHAHSGGSDQPKWNGIAKPGIYGPTLDGKHGFAAIRDTDHGVLDKDKKWDRAVGPMQFLPSTWQTWGGTTKGKLRDPQDIRAATIAAGGYLCASSADLSKLQGMATAVYSYNHSFDYVRLVLSVGARYAGIDPNALGVDRLPKDKPKKEAKKKAAASPKPSPSASSTAGSRATSSSPSPSPSSSKSSSSPAPAPSSPPSLPPLPTPSSTPL